MWKHDLKIVCPKQPPTWSLITPLIIHFHSGITSDTRTVPYNQNSTSAHTIGHHRIKFEPHLSNHQHDHPLTTSFPFLQDGYVWDPNGQGEMGKGVLLLEDEAEQHRATETFEINQFNLVASNKIAVNRSLPDFRPPRLEEKQMSGFHAL